MRTSFTTTARRFVRWEFLPELALLVGLTVFFVHQNDAATSAFKSTKALAIMTAATVAWLGGRLMLARLVRFAPARAAVFTVAAVVALSVVVFPAYDNDTVVEAFPEATAAAAPAPTSSTTTVPPPTAVSAAAVTAEPAPATTSTTVGRAATPVTMTVTPTAPERTTTTTAARQVEVAPAAAAAAQPAPAGPQRLRTGMFRGIDHRASGTGAIYRQPDGRYVVGLEDIDIQPGPDYDLYVVPGENREDTRGGVRLDDLRGNRGTQFYEVPDGVNLENGPWTVLVWCQTFAVPVAGATPA